MRLKDFINEAKIFQNNSVKVDMVVKELKRVFIDNEIPKIYFDEDGLFIWLDNFQTDIINENPLKQFSLIESIKDKETKKTKFYIEYFQTEDR